MLPPFLPSSMPSLLHTTPSTVPPSEQRRTPRSLMDRDSDDNDTKKQADILSEHTSNTSLSGLSLYEKKSLLINQEFDRMGMGRYQWAIFLLCGFGYFLDLMWAQAFGLIITAIAQEFDVSAEAQANIFTAFSAGLTAGALTWGILVDVIGRKWSFNLTCLITSIFGFLIAAPPRNYEAICALTALCGFGLGGNIPIDATITLEFLPQNRRFLLALLSLFQPLGVMASSLLALALVPSHRCDVSLPACTSSGQQDCCTRSSNIGWRYYVIVLGSITLGVFIVRFVIFTFHESPRFLLACGRDEDAITVVSKIAKFNKADSNESTLSIESFRALDREDISFRSTPSISPERGAFRSALSRLTQVRCLFSTKALGITTVLLWICYMGDFWAFNIAGAFLPIILQRHGAEVNQSITETYRQYVYIYTPGILGSILAAASMNISKLGRKWAMVLSAALMAVSMFLYVSITTIKASVGLNALEYIMQTYFNALLYAFTPEVYDGPYRGTACGIASTLGRLAGIVAPKAAAPYLAAGSNGVLYMAGGGALLAMVAIALVPIETSGRQTY